MTIQTRHTLLWSLRIGLLEGFAWLGIQAGDNFHQDIARNSRAYPVAIWSAIFGAIAFWIALKVIKVEGERRFEFWPLLFWGAILMEALWGSQTLLWPLFKSAIPNFEVRFWIWAFISSTLGAVLVYRTYLVFVRLQFRRLLIRWREPLTGEIKELNGMPGILLVPFGIYEAIFGFITLRVFTQTWSKEHWVAGFFIWFGTGAILSLATILITRTVASSLKKPSE